MISNTFISGNTKDVNIQDQTTRSIDSRVNQTPGNPFGIIADTVIDTYTITFTPGHGLIIGDKIALAQQIGNDIPILYTGTILNLVGDTATMDTLICCIFYPASSFGLKIVENMNVNGSVTYQSFGITNLFTVSADFTIFNISIIDSTPMDDALFGGGPALTRGLTFRKKFADGSYENYWNIKTNGDIKELAKTNNIYSDKAPSGKYGLNAPLYYAGQANRGVAIRLQVGEKLEFVVQDDWTVFDNAYIMTTAHLTKNY